MAPNFANGQCRSFRGDGLPDLLVRDTETGELFVHPHSGEFNGTDTFRAPVKIGDGFGWWRFFFVRAVDASGDGRADICAFSTSEYDINPGENGEFGFFLLRNLGGPGEIGPFAEPLRVSSKRDDGREWETIGFADVTGTGTDDTFGRGKNAGNIDLFPHRDQGVVRNDTYDKEPVRLVDVDVDDFPVAMADFTGNGTPDLLVRRANGDMDLFEFAGKPGTTAEGTWHTVARGWQDMRIMTLTDIDLDGRPDLLGLRPDGTLDAYAHSGVFNPQAPLDLFREPVTVATGFGKYDVVS
ncbi:VCBS repeat-containing protein [Nonomuraea sp. B1E8]|uniref:FG-GAP repeat domain-containing protein n=1 Tax=unclassified Nonomuraea TaxID=2593643 RepID=UPI00325EDE05